MRGSGGSEGGVGLFVVGSGLAALAVYLLLDSVLVTAGTGWISGVFPATWWGATTSTGILFVPFVLGVIALFYDASKRWAWWLMYFGFGVIIVEILSRVRFMMQMKTTHLLLLLVLFGAGVGLILRSFREEKLAGDAEHDKAKDGDKGE